MFKIRKITAMILCLLLAFSSMSIAFGATDYDGHWAKATIDKWVGEGKMSGYPDGTFKPNIKVTRAEFVKMVNSIIEFDGTSNISYNDVSSNDWYYTYVQVAQAIGYIKGYENNNFGPNDYITREQAASILARIQYLDANAKAANSFSDADKISSWAIDSVGGAVEADFIKGYENGEFRPTNNLTRAEAITMLDNVLNNSKNYVVYKAGTIKDLNVEGNLIIAKTVGNGKVTLENVTVKGDIIAVDGSVKELNLNNVKSSRVVVENKDAKITLGKDTVIDEIVATVVVSIDNKSGEVKKVTITADEKITLAGKYNDVVLSGEGNVAFSDATVEKLTVNKKIDLLGKGTIQLIVANANGIRYESGVKLVKVELGPGVTVPPALIGQSSGGSSGGGGGGPTTTTKEYAVSVNITSTKGNTSQNTFTSYNENEKMYDFIIKEAESILNSTDSRVVNAIDKFINKLNAELIAKSSITLPGTSITGTQTIWNEIIVELGTAPIANDLLQFETKFLSGTLDKSDLKELVKIAKTVTATDVDAIETLSKKIDKKYGTTIATKGAYTITFEKTAAPTGNLAILDFITDQYNSQIKAKDFFDTNGKITVNATNASGTITGTAEFNQVLLP